MGRIKIFILILGLGLSTACTKRAVDFQPDPVEKDFGPLLSDKTLDLTKAQKPLKPSSPPKDQTMTTSSVAWFDLANQLLEGNSSAKPMGFSLIENFYKLNDSHTTMTGTVNPPGSPFAEAAYWFARPVMTKAYDDSILAAESKIVSLAKTVVVPVNDLEKYPPPATVLDRMIQSLNTFKDNLARQNGDGDQVLDAITSEIDTKFTPDLQDMKKSATFDAKIPLIDNLRSLEGSLAKLPELSDFDRQHLLMQVRIAITLTSICDQIKNSDDALSFLVDVWLAKEMRKNFPNQLKNAFAGLSEGQIFALATENQNQIIPDSKWLTVKNETDTLILEDSSLVALYLKNDGLVLDPATWTAFQQHVSDFNSLMSAPDISYFARLVGNIPSNQIADQRFAVVGSWLGVPYRIGVPDEIRTVFSQLSEQDLELIQNNNYLFLFARMDKTLGRYRYGLIDALDKRGIGYVKQLFNTTITSTIKERLDLALIPIAKDYSNQISNTIVQVLEKRRGEGEKVSASSYNDFGRYYLGKLIFGVPNLKKGDSQSEAQDNSLIKKSTLPLIEKSNVSFVYKDNQWVSVESAAETNPNVLGLSLGVVEERVNHDPQNATDIEFGAISKLLAMSGYHDSKNNLTESFMTSMTANHLNQLFSVADYDPKAMIFAVPEDIKIKDNYKMASASRISPRVNVMGQMRLLYGYAKLMKFFKPWNPSVYDAGLGAIRIDEDKTLIPFERKDYFVLTTGLSAYILRNIPYRMLGLISSDHKFIDGTKVDEPSKVDAIAATLSDYTPEGMSHKITASSVATAILAMSEFYGQITDLQKSQDQRIQDTLKGDGFRESQENLQKIISGLVLFATVQLKSADGGFFHSFDLEKMAPIPGERFLDDQLMMEEALLRGGSALQSGFMTSRAIDNLFFLNSHFWNADLGFYKASENDGGGRVWLVDVARAIHNINVIMVPNNLTQGPNDQSLEQMQRLRDLWIGRFFDQQIQNLPPILQVSEFSL
jgi:hypothetical protein